VPFPLSGPLPSPCPRRGLGRGSTQSRRDSIDDTIDICKHFVVPEADNPKPALFDQPGAPVIFGHLIGVMASVELDHNFRLRACEISDKVSDGELPLKPKLDQPLRSQSTPEFLFRLRLITAQSAGAMVWKGNRPDVSCHRGNSRLGAIPGVAPLPATPVSRFHWPHRLVARAGVAPLPATPRFTRLTPTSPRTRRG
jgi:hypothetical protein